jgi:hypothetical protein
MEILTYNKVMYYKKLNYEPTENIRKIFSENIGTLQKIKPVENELIIKLNKLSNDNIDKSINDIISIGFETKKQIDDFVKILYNKAIHEQIYVNLYSKLSKALYPLYIEENGNKIYIRNILLGYCHKEFMNVINGNYNIERSDGIIGFLCGLYNIGFINNKIINECFNSIMSMVTNHKANGIELLCLFVKRINKNEEFKEIIKTSNIEFSNIDKLKLEIINY